MMKFQLRIGDGRGICFIIFLVMCNAERFIGEDAEMAEPVEEGIAYSPSQGVVDEGICASSSKGYCWVDTSM
jgi:hypothetical protein